MSKMDNNRRTFPPLLKIGCWTTAFFVFTVVIVVWGLLAPTSTGVWDGAFPPGEFHIVIEDPDGKPIPGAVFHVFGRGNSLAYDYPIDNHSSSHELVSNEQGIIVALHKPQGIEFGGGCYVYFWFYEKCSEGPEYFGQITADGYHDKDFSINELIFKPAYEEKTESVNSIVLENGEELEIPVYTITIVLEKQG